MKNKTKKKKIVLGLVEKIEIGGKKYKGRVDTGAKRSCVCKSIADELNFGKPIKKVKTVSANGKSRRPVIKTKTILKGKKMKATFSIYNREDMEYPVLIGRNILRRGFIINPRK